MAKLSLLGVEPAEMLWLLAAGWGVSLDPTQSLGLLWRALTDRLIEYRYQHLGAVALLDDADQADPQVLQHVTRLVRLRSVSRDAADARVGRPQRENVAARRAAT